MTYFKGFNKFYDFHGLHQVAEIDHHNFKLQSVKLFQKTCCRSSLYQNILVLYSKDVRITCKCINKHHMQEKLNIQWNILQHLVNYNHPIPLGFLPLFWWFGSKMNVDKVFTMREGDSGILKGNCKLSPMVLPLVFLMILSHSLSEITPFFSLCLSFEKPRGILIFLAFY